MSYAILSLNNPKERVAIDSATLPSLWITPDPLAPDDSPDKKELVDGYAQQSETLKTSRNEVYKLSQDTEEYLQQLKGF